MLLDQVSVAEVHTAQILTGTTMAAFLAAGMFGPRAGRIRMAIVGVYFAAILTFVIYILL